MQKHRFMMIAGIATILSIAPFLLMRQSPEVKIANRIHEQYLAAQAPVLRPDSGVRDAEKFLVDLKAIDVADVPEEVQHAMTLMISVVEANLAVHRTGGDVDAANGRVADAQKDLLLALGKWRAEPFDGDPIHKKAAHF